MKKLQEIISNININLNIVNHEQPLQAAIYGTKGCVPLYADKTWKTIVGFSYWDSENDPNAEEAYDYMFTEEDVAAIDAAMPRIRFITGGMPFDKDGLHATGREVLREFPGGWVWKPEYEGDASEAFPTTEDPEEDE